MRLWQAFSWLCLFLASGAMADTGAVTLVEGNARLLRGATWFKLGGGVAIQEADIVDIPERAQVQIEFAAGTIVNLVGPGALYVSATPAKGGPIVAMYTGGWLKAATKAPGLRLRVPSFDAVIAGGIVVVHADHAADAIFVETGAATLIELAPNGRDGVTHDAKRSEYWAKAAGGAFTTAASAPRPFVSAMPRHFEDSLPTLAGKAKAVPTPAAERDITYAEAAPWLGGRDRALFEKRFVTRLRDPAFRKAAEPDLARHPAWDRIVHPEKYEPKDKPAP